MNGHRHSSFQGEVPAAAPAVQEKAQASSAKTSDLSDTEKKIRNIRKVCLLWISKNHHISVFLFGVGGELSFSTKWRYLFLKSNFYISIYS